MKLIDVIIPVYKAHSTLMRTLSSIACQSIVDNIRVTLVNDCCPEGDYQYFVDKFSDVFEINEIKLEKNGGPGVARQFGIDNTDCPFFTCIDADDTFAGAFALDSLLKVMNKDIKIKCVSGVFNEVHPEGFAPHHADMVWMFGKLYRRDFINKYNIRFNETRANEDTGFNSKVKLLCSYSDDESVVFLNDLVYYWHEKVDSITRINNCQYSYDQSFCGWTDNMIDAYNFCKKAQPFNGIIDSFAVDNMFKLYTYFCECAERAPVFKEQNWHYVKKYYNKVYKNLEDKISEETKKHAYSEAMKHSYDGGSFLGIIPIYSINEFFDKLKEEPYSDDEIYKIYESIPDELLENNVKCGVCEKDYYKESLNK